MEMFAQRKKILKFVIFGACICGLVGLSLVFYLEKEETERLDEEGLKGSYSNRFKELPVQSKFYDVSNSKKMKNEHAKQLIHTKPRPEHERKDNVTLRHVNNNVHIFYYSWYGNLRVDGRYFHWDHPYLPHWNKVEAAKWPHGRHTPPDDVGSSFYPELGAYSSRDPKIVELHMQQIQRSGAGVVSVSWYPKGEADDQGKEPDQVVPLILDMADKYKLKVNFHIEPFKNRNHITLREQVQYILDNYGSHPAFYRQYDKRRKSYLPLFYIYDSYQVAASDWAKLLRPEGKISIRNTGLDGIFIGLLVNVQHKEEILRAGFDGFYTYFATNGFTYGSSLMNWRYLMKFARSNNLLFIPSVGPGYIDTSVRPWNGKNIRSRENGNYYRSSFQMVVNINSPFVSITSFNEWHEGTQIESAIPKNTSSRVYLDYGVKGPTFYLDLTRQLIEIMG